MICPERIIPTRRPDGRRLGQLAEDAAELARAAQAEAFAELGDLATSLRLQLLSVRHRFRLFQRRRGAAGEP